MFNNLDSINYPFAKSFEQQQSKGVEDAGKLIYKRFKASIPMLLLLHRRNSLFVRKAVFDTPEIFAISNKQVYPEFFYILHVTLGRTV